MSQSLLYHAFGVREGYEYVKTGYVEGRVEFHLAVKDEKLVCPECGAGPAMRRGKRWRRIRTVPIGLKEVVLAAVAGVKAARGGLGIVAGAARGSAVAAKAILPEYRLLLFGRGEEAGLDEEGGPLRRGFKPEEVDAVLAAKGRLDHWQMLRCRVRYFADGLALGTKTFVNEVFAARREHFGPKRTTGARALRNVEANGLCALRDLRVRALAAC